VTSMWKVSFGAGLLAACALAASAQPAASREPAAPLVESIEVVNNQFLQTETLLFYIQTKPGDRVDARKLREDFRRLWDTGFLDDLQIDVVDGTAGGKIVRFKVQERKRIQIVDFRGNKQLPTKDIEEELKKRDAQIRVDTFYDPAKARRVEAIIKEMLVLKGRPFGTVRHGRRPWAARASSCRSSSTRGRRRRSRRSCSTATRSSPTGSCAGR
jgi:outer membrane protein assembly factor BamA